MHLEQRYAPVVPFGRVDLEVVVGVLQAEELFITVHAANVDYPPT